MDFSLYISKLRPYTVMRMHCEEFVYSFIHSFTYLFHRYLWAIQCLTSYRFHTVLGKGGCHYRTLKASLQGMILRVSRRRVSFPWGGQGGTKWRIEDEVGRRVDEKTDWFCPLPAVWAQAGLVSSRAVLLHLSVMGLELLSLALKHCASLKGSTEWCLGPL